MKIYLSRKISCYILLLISCVAVAKYNIHIEGGNLNLKNWLDICKNDENLQRMDKFESINPKTGEKIIISTKYSCLWQDKQTNIQYWFHFSNDRISISGGKAQIKIAKQIAIILNAKVFGDEGEEY